MPKFAVAIGIALRQFAGNLSLRISQQHFTTTGNRHQKAASCFEQG
tara:strand:- start:90015 stop:90152 length:138 start_codon:yes stop_codon:yes gene_type:complete